MLRTSSHTIYVDLPGNSEEMLLVHGYTGAYDKVSRRVATYVRSLEAGEPPKPLYGEWSPEPPIDGEPVVPSDETIAVLRTRGYLTDLSRADEDALFTQVATAVHDLNRTPGYVFMPTYDCNLRCSYCFQDHMRTDPTFSHLLRTMDRPLIDRIFAAIPKIEAFHNMPENSQRRRSFGFFGGEPLLEGNHATIAYIVGKAQALGQASFWAITNGTELDAYRDLLGAGGIGFLQITLDGPPSEHDRRRIYADGGGSFERIAQNLTMALDLGAQVSVRMNVDRNNVGQLPELADEIVARGWNRRAKFSAYTATIHAANKKTSAKSTFGSWELDQSMNRLREQYSNMRVIDRPDDAIKDKARQIFNSKETPQFRSTFCGAHNGMYLFDAFGDIYACWERTGDPKIRIGCISQDAEFVVNAQVNAMWRSRNVTSNPTCRKCRYALYCGGGCAVLAQEKRGKFFTNYCDGFAARFRASVAEGYLDHIAGAAQGTSAGPPCHV
jgi:uncharacterized protein